MRDEDKTKEQLIRELQNGRREFEQLQVSWLGLARNSIAQSASAFQSLCAESGHPIWIYAAETLAFLEVNEAALVRYGYGRNEFLGLHLTDMLADNDAFQGIESDKTARRALSSWEKQQHRRKDGSVIDVEITSQELWFAGQEARLVFSKNSTERKRIEATVQESEERFSKVFHASPMAMNIRRLDDGRFVDVNETYLRAVGFSREQVLGRTPVELGLWENPADYEQFMEMVKQGEPVRNLECRLRVKAGRIAVVLVTAELIEVGGQQCVVVITNDISRRKREEEALKASEERFSKVFHSSPVTMTIRRLHDGRYVNANNQYLRATGQRLEEILGRTPLELGLWENPAEYETFMEMVRQGQTVRDFECRLLIKTGEVAICLLNAEIIEADGQQCVLVITANITERKRAEEEREQLIAQLQEALAKVKTLSGFLPICASCKMIRDDKGYWNQIEEYIGEHSEAEFSHSICPQCSEKLYGEFLRKRKGHP